MNPDPSTLSCCHCGSTNLATAVPMGLPAEVGSLGLKYKDGLLLVGTEPLVADVCTACGHVQRLYVRHANHRWLGQVNKPLDASG